ncbi:MAG TPA: dTDP-4-dehydrorhamnose 3,5-epimerase [Acidobacteriaceae bacterium]|jgi:dTDP-4-dehydrorhamnose 3,5-epimerase|nr:dTDP-4-dehydrorhamnose 3,5-epimerase [Acidobacteriaceae bacterium]
MKVEETSLPGVLLVTLDLYRDHRGAFCETWNQRSFSEAGVSANWVQDNYSYSLKNVVRAFHYQIFQPQAKLVRVTHGAAFDVAIDLRGSSPNFGRHVAVELTAEKPQLLFIPAGFGHGFLALSQGVGIAFKVSDYYCAEAERTLLWNDPDLAIEWPIGEEDAILTDRDRSGSLLFDAEVFPGS